MAEKMEYLEQCGLDCRLSYMNDVNVQNRAENRMLSNSLLYILGMPEAS